MDAVGDTVVVHGNATFNVQSYNGSATSLGNLTAGVLRIRGNFAQTTEYAATGAAFAATGTTVALGGRRSGEPVRIAWKAGLEYLPQL